MIKNYFLVAIRNLKRNKVFSVINIVGLALGLTCSLLIMLWVLDERSTDQFHEKKDRLYSVYERQFTDGRIQGGHYTPGLLAQELKKQFPEVEMSTGMAWDDYFTFQVGDKILRQDGNFADSNFFQMFTYPLLEGDPKTALSSPNSLAISRKMATAFFGSPAAAYGKTIKVQNDRDFLVTAVFEDMPHNSTLKWEYVLNWHYMVELREWIKEWDNNGPGTMLLLRPDADPKKFEAKIRNFMDKYLAEIPGWKIELCIQKYSDRYLYSNIKDGYIAGGRIEYVRLFSIVAIFILLIACINFMNLTTARSIKRSREIGVRKVVGAIRPALIRQFIGEAIVVAGLAMIVALALLFSFLPVFNSLTQKQIAFPYQQITFWASIIGLIFVTGLLSGSYPALFLSSFRPIVVLKGVMKVSSSANWFRKGLVVFQFALSSLLIIGTIVVSQQVKYIQNKNLGFNRENIVRVTLQGDLGRQSKLFRKQIADLPGVTAVTRSEADPMQMGNSTIGVDWEGKVPGSKPLFMQTGIGYEFVKTMEMKLVEGREFSKDFGTDTAAYILNESAIKKIAYKDPIGKPFTLWGRKGTIIGVVQDFHYTSMHNPIQPLIFRLVDTSSANYGYVFVRVEAAKTKSVIASIEKIAKELSPQFVFTYDFADDQFKKLYESEAMIQKLSNCFAGLAIVISCLGLLGLAMFAAEQRVREIGIRKVLGANLQSLFLILSKEFLLLVFVAFVIACPLAWWAMNNWLHDFEYRITLTALPFVLAGVAALTIALFTISFQTVKAALANPIKSLRSE